MLILSVRKSHKKAVRQASKYKKDDFTKYTYLLKRKKITAHALFSFQRLLIANILGKF